MSQRDSLSSEPVVTLPDFYIQEIVWKRLVARQPTAQGRYRILNAQGFESIGHYFPAEDDEEAGWVTMDFDGSILYWAELNGSEQA